MKKNNEEITFKDILSIFLPKLWLILLVAIVAGVALGAYSANKPDTYTSTSILDIKKDSDAINISDIDLANSVIMKIGKKVESDDFLIRIIAETYGNPTGLTPSFILSSLSYVPLDNGMLRVSITTQDSELSLYIAQAFESLLPSEFATYSSYQLVAVPFNSAKLSTVPNDKGVLKNAVIGFVGGGVISAVAVWIAYVVDSTVRSKKRLEDSFDYPILGSIPSVKKAKSGKEETL